MECARKIHTPLFMLHQRSHIDDKPFSPTLPPAMPPDSASPIEAFLRGTELFFKQSSDEIGKAIEKVLSPEKKEPDSERVDTPRSRRFEAIDEPDIDVVDRSTKAEQRNIMPATAFTQLERRERQEVAARAMDLEMKALRESLSPTVVARATADEVEVESLSLAGSTEAEAQALVTKAIAEAMAEAVVAEVASNAVAAQESQARAIAFQGAIKAMEPGRKQQLLDSTDEFSSEAASSAEKRTVRLAATEVTAATEAAAATKEAAPPEEKATASQTPSTLCPSPDRRSLLELIQRSAERSARHDPYYDVAAQLSRYHPSAAAEAAAEAAELTLAQKREKEEAMAGKRRHLSTGEVVSIKTEKEAILDALLQRKREEAEVRGIVIETASTNEVTHGLLRAGLSGLLQAKLTAQQEFDLKKAQKRAEEEARTAADANYPSPQGDSAEAFREEPRLDASVTFLVREALDELRLDDDASEDQEHAQHDAGEMLTGALEAGEAEEDPAWLQDATLHLEIRQDATLQLEVRQDTTLQLEEDEEALSSPADASVSVDVRTDEEPTWLADAETILFKTPSPRASFGSLLSEATSSPSPRRRRSFQALPLATEERAPSGGGAGNGGVHDAATHGSFEDQTDAVSDSGCESAESGADDSSARRPSSSSSARCSAAGAVLGTTWGGPASRLSSSLVRGSPCAGVGEWDDVLEPEPSAVYARATGHRSLAQPITSGLAPAGIDGGAPARASDEREAIGDRTREPAEALEVAAASLRARLVGLFVLLALLAFVLLAWLVDGCGVSVAVLLDVLRATVAMAREKGQRASAATSTDEDDEACAVDIEDCESIALMKLAPAQTLPPSLTPSPAQPSPWLGRRLWRLTCLTFMLGLLLERLAIEARRVHRLIRGMPHGVGGGSSPSALQSYDLSLLGGLVERLPLLTDLLADGALEGSAKGLACLLAVAAARAEFM